MIIITSFTADQINNCFLKNGWDIEKPLDEIDDEYICEDLAQFSKESIVVDFGFYGDVTAPNEGKFGIYIIDNNDWENYMANFRFRDFNLSLSVMRFLSSAQHVTRIST